MSENVLYRKAKRHLSRQDPVLKPIITRIGHCTLQTNPDGFGCLVRSIIAQQISSKAAIAISLRLEKALGRRGCTPKGILKLSDEAMRAAGLSASKTKSLRDLADKVHSKIVPLDALHQMPDEEVITSLIPVRGIGRWTAEMFLIFSLGRTDVLPVDDFGLRKAVQQHYQLAELPGKAEIVPLAEPWRPFRSIATWYLWRSLGAVPQSE